MSDQITMLYDVNLRRPACILLAAVARTDSSLLPLWGRNWLVHPTPGMKRIAGTRAQWEELAKRDNQAGAIKPEPRR